MSRFMSLCFVAVSVLALVAGVNPQEEAMGPVKIYDTVYERVDPGPPFTEAPRTVEDWQPPFSRFADLPTSRFAERIWLGRSLALPISRHPSRVSRPVYGSALIEIVINYGLKPVTWGRNFDF